MVAGMGWQASRWRGDFLEIPLAKNAIFNEEYGFVFATRAVVLGLTARTRANRQKDREKASQKYCCPHLFHRVPLF